VRRPLTQKSRQKFLTALSVVGLERKYFLTLIDIGEESLSGIKGRRRDVSALTVSVDQATSEKIKSMVHGFQINVLEVAEQCSDPNHVYHINIQFFTSTRDD